MMVRRLAVVGVLLGAWMCVGCLPVVGGVIAALLDAVGTDKSENSAPVVLVDPIPRTSTTVTIPLRVFDTDGDTVTLTVRYRRGSNEFVAATLIGETAVVGTTSGASFALTWDAPTDLGATTYIDDLEVEVRSTDGNKNGTPALSGAFEFGNDPPSVSVQTVVGLQGDNITIAYTVADSSADPVDLTVEYERGDAPGVWEPATILLAPATTSNISTTSGGIQYPVTWLAGTDLAGVPAFRGNARIRITANDGLPSTPGISNEFAIRHNTVPTASFADDPLPAGPFTGNVYGRRITFRATIEDPELDFARVELQYTINDGTTWHHATLFGNFQALASGFPTPETHNIVWDSVADLPNSVETVRLRIRANDTNIGAWTELQNAFTVDNVNTNAAPTINVTGGGAIPVAADRWHVIVTGNAQLSSIVTITGTDTEPGDLITLTLTFNAGKSENYALMPAELAFNPGAVGDTSIGVATAPSAATINVLPNGPFTVLGTVVFDILVEDDAGNSDTGELHLIVRDLVPPFFGGVESAVASSPFTIDVAYSSAVDDFSDRNEISYRIYYSTTTPVPTAVAAFATEPGQVSFVVGGLSPSTQYHFVVRAVDDAGNEDSNPVTISATTPSGPSYAWQATAALSVSGEAHAAVPLTDGRVLLCGGHNGADLDRAAIFDPATGAWTATDPMSIPRRNHTATVLPDGRVLVVGGQSGASVAASCEIYDPALGMWSGTTAIPSARQYHTATLTTTGKVIVIGGDPTTDQTDALADAFVFDPTAESWTAVASLPEKRAGHQAIYTNEKIYAVAGWNGSAAVATIFVYDLDANTWDLAGTLATPRVFHSATLLADRRILVAGGFDGVSVFIGSAEIVNPATGAITPAATMGVTRAGHPAALLPSGHVLIAGGMATTITSRSSTEIYDPRANTWTASGFMNTARANFPLVQLPSGDLLAPAGRNGIFFTANVDLFDPTRGAGTWIATGDIRTARVVQSAMLMPNGKVLMTGGYVSGLFATPTAEIFDPVTTTWDYAASNTVARVTHASILLPDGRVLVAGGYGVFLAFPFALASGEIYDPATDTWSTAGAMNTARAAAASALLPDGKILMAGGFVDSSTPSSAVELYDPASNTWSNGLALPSARGVFPVATLQNGRVALLFGNTTIGDPTNNGFVYAPTGPSWTTTPVAARVRSAPATVAMPDGRILVMGGSGTNGSNADYYNPATNTFAAAPNLPGHREAAPATLLFSGKVLMPGGANGTGAFTFVLGATHTFNPATGTWNTHSNLQPARKGHTAVLLPSGRVLVCGGTTDNGSFTPTLTSRLFDDGRGFAETWRPRITDIDGSSTFPAVLTAGDAIALNGRNFRGPTRAGIPTVTLIGPISNQSGTFEFAQGPVHGPQRRLDATEWASGTMLKTTLPALGTFTPGYYMLVVTASGIPSTAIIVHIS